MASEEMGRQTVSYSVRVLSVGESKIRGPEVFWMSHWDEILPLAFNVTLIQGEGITALVNTSPPDDDTITRRDFPAMRYLHAAPDGDLERTPDQMMLGALALAGLRPQDITHLHPHAVRAIHDRDAGQVPQRSGVHVQTGMDPFSHHPRPPP